ncbi:MAG: HipA domain-containing protein [Bacteroidales bacterium]|jgi:serine/threonine-protein kinase HipA|nr:HipA domain-containing protein [Bacteroidales bacterium]
MKRCLYCYRELSEGEVDFHPSCAKKIFGSKSVPLLPYTRDNINDLANQIVRSKTTVTGVQPKLSMDINRGGKDEPDKLTIVDLSGYYILKPQSRIYPALPEDEDLTMHLAGIAGIKVVPHSLVRFSDGELCYITRRIDREKDGTKYPMEDMCQITGRMTEDKYKSSYEKIAKAVMNYSAVPRLDLVNFWEIVLFSWLTGNSDMHLKNFSLIGPDNDGFQLAKAYDLLSVHLVMPEDKEELALTLNGKKNRIKKVDFEKSMLSTGLDEKVILNTFKKFIKLETTWYEFIGISFLPPDLKEKYKEQISQKMNLIK